jgi:ribose transport system ATP-binding protein
VVIARWLRTGARAFLLQEPTNGVDTGAKQTIYAALGDAIKTGAAVLISSSDAEELCAICDRVIVMNAGRVGAVLQGEALTVPNLLAACMAASESVPSGHEHAPQSPANTAEGKKKDE